jgi:hypothetical protein
MKKIVLIAILLATPALARGFTSTVTQSDRIEQLRPEFKIPDEPNQLFYVQRSPNANTIVYAAHRDDKGKIDTSNPVEAFWRKFNIDGSKQSLNMIERMMAYGVRVDRAQPGKPTTFSIAALPERKFELAFDAHHGPEALLKMGEHTVIVRYIYLQVKEGGLMPDVPSLDIFGIDAGTGKAVHEHLVKTD